jgi:hypothetical protein
MITLERLEQHENGLVFGGDAVAQMVFQLLARFDQRIDRQVFPPPQRLWGDAKPYDVRTPHTRRGTFDKRLSFPHAVQPAKRLLLEDPVRDVITWQGDTLQRPFRLGGQENLGRGKRQYFGQNQTLQEDDKSRNDLQAERPVLTR